MLSEWGSHKLDLTAGHTTLGNVLCHRRAIRKDQANVERPFCLDWKFVYIISHLQPRYAILWKVNLGVWNKLNRPGLQTTLKNRADWWFASLATSPRPAPVLYLDQ